MSKDNYCSIDETHIISLVGNRCHKKGCKSGNFENWGYWVCRDCRINYRQCTRCFIIKLKSEIPPELEKPKIVEDIPE